MMYFKELENFPHIFKEISSNWGTKKCRNYLNGLVLNTTGRVNKNPEGFPPNVISSIIKLLNQHDIDYPQCIERTSVWGPV